MLPEWNLISSAIAPWQQKCCYSAKYGSKTLHECGNSQKSLPISSLTKQFTAAAVLSCPDIETSAPITEFLPKYTNLKNIVVSDLLNQTSGVSEYLYEPTEDQLRSWSLNDCCDFIASLEFSSDKVYKYSNSNFVLLTKIIENVADTTYREYLHSLFFTPIGMENTTIPGDFSSGFHGWGDANIHSSVQDLQKWYQSAEFKNYLNHIGGLEPFKQERYVAGLFRQKNGYYFHSGSKPGCSSFALHDPSTNSSFVLLCDFDPDPKMMDILHDLFDAN
jgi:CubicO group peptidase (beta-lactamase class C family)